MIYQPIQLHTMRLSKWLFISLLYLQLPVYSLAFVQTEPKVSISGTYTLQKIFQKIEQQTGKRIFYANSILDDQEKINIKAVNNTITEVLSQILSGKKLEWSIEPKFITIVEIRNQPAPKSTFTEADTTITVTGRVTNEKGEPIIGATVVVKNTKRGITTTNDGSFTLRNVIPNSLLIISNVAYLNQEVAVRSRQSIGTITLKEYVGDLDETIVIAYGTTTKRLNTGNVSTIKAKEIERSPVNNPILAVAGRIPGIQITQSTGFSGSGVDILIQGQNSLQKGSVPFYVIDGVPYTQQLLPNLANILGTSGRGAGDGPINGNPLSYINPADIESIDVLKDADATAIYGSRAANGAIIITTKKGKAGKLKVDINIQTGAGQVSRRMKLLNTQQYLEMRKEAKANDGAPIFDSDYDLNGDWDQNKYTDWQKELLGKNAHYNDAQLSISGGNANTQYSVGTGYHKETTVFSNDLADEKASLRFNINGVSNDQRFHITLSGTYLLDNNKLPNVDLTQNAMQRAPNSPALYNADGSLNWAKNSAGVSTIDNPIAGLTSFYKNKTINTVTNANVSYQIIPGLVLKSNLGYTNMQTDEILTIPSTIAPPEFRSTFGRTADYGTNNINSWIIEPQISFDHVVGTGQLNVLIGTTIQQNNSSRKLIEGSGYASDLVLENVNAASDVRIPENSTIQSTYKYNAAFARINYNFQDKYILNLSARRDGSSRFGPENRFHNFGAVGAAWIFSNENFIKDELSFLSFGKLKGSYGTTGNDQIGDYAYLSLYNYNNPVVPYLGGTGLTPNKLFNPLLQWEETRKFSLGVDIGLFNDRILLNTTFYRNRSSNLLILAQLPATTGPYSLNVNFPATVQNSGWETSLNTTNIKLKNFNWSTNINLTIPKNKLVTFDDLASSFFANDYIIGKSINTAKAYRLSGVNPTTGVYEYLDKDGKITNDPGSDPLNNNVYFNRDPKFYGGITNTLSYKGFELSFLFQFVKQMGQNFIPSPPGRTTINQPISVLNRWQKPGDIKPVQRYASNDFSIILPFYNLSGSDGVWEDASYIRLKNTSISWNFPQNWITKAKLQNCRLYMQGQNLLTFTHYKGLDPETKSSLTLPPLRIFTFGIQVTL